VLGEPNECTSERRGVESDGAGVEFGEVVGDGEGEVTEDDLDTSVYRDDQIDVNEVLREQFYLVLPMKPLCREDCAGLCPQCGTNLNGGACGCEPPVEDPRLAPLRKLMKTGD